MSSYYDVNSAIRYYGLLPAAVEKPAPESTPLDYEPVHFTFGAKVSDPMKWIEPVHVAVSNLRALKIASGAYTSAPEPARADTAALYRFLKTYGSLTHESFHEGISLSGSQFSEDPLTFGKLQFVLRSAWAGNKEAISLVSGEEDKEKADGFSRWARFLHVHKWEGTASKGYSLPTSWWDSSDPLGARLRVRISAIEIEPQHLWDFTRLLFMRDYLVGDIGVCENPDCVTRYFVKKRKGQVYCCHKCAVLMNVRAFRNRERKAE